MKTSRRDFLRSGIKGLLGGIVLYGGISTLLRNLALVRATPEAKLGEYDWNRYYWGFAVDATKCIGCGRCLVACKLENDVPLEPEYNRTWVERYVINEDGQVFVDSPKDGGINGFDAEHTNAKNHSLELRKSFFVPKLCNQCDKPPCLRVCPTQATYMTADGVVLINRNRCIGCKYCIVACPYGVRFIDPRLNVADKCTWCYHRITKGMMPACVEACPVGARVFGDLRDPESAVRKIVRENRVNVLKPTLGTEPKVYYVGIEAGGR